jgi:hypothetical protein
VARRSRAGRWATSRKFEVAPPAHPPKKTCEIAVSGGNGDEVARALADMGARFVVLTEEPDGTVH